MQSMITNKASKSTKTRRQKIVNQNKNQQNKVTEAVQSTHKSETERALSVTWSNKGQTHSDLTLCVCGVKEV